MRRIALVFAICVGIIVLTNCQQTGGSSYSSYRPRPDPAAGWNKWIDDKNAELDAKIRANRPGSVESRIERLEEQVADLSSRLRLVESRTRPQMQ